MKTFLPIRTILASTFCLLASLGLAAKVYEVKVDNFKFTPSALSVQVGDTVRWTWVAGDHTTTSTSVPAGAATWNSLMTAAVTKFDYVVTTAGMYSYQCNPHSSVMKGTITATAKTSGVTSPAGLVVNNLKVFPNPFTSRLSIDFTNSSVSYSSATVEIFNALGVLVYKENLGNRDEVLKRPLLSLSLEDLPKGVYFMNVSGDDQKSTFRVIKSE